MIIMVDLPVTYLVFSQHFNLCKNITPTRSRHNPVAHLRSLSLYICALTIEVTPEWYEFIDITMTNLRPLVC